MPTQLGQEAINKSFKFLKEAMRSKKQYLLVQPNPDDTQLPAKIVRS